ncbi:MAG: 26S protease regulatory subunit [Planctomycetaceae bacterium]|nr:26S protease regulatory subunit [Planctomycetaceae bacterium]
MISLVAILGWLFFGTVVGAVGTYLWFQKARFFTVAPSRPDKILLFPLIHNHFLPNPIGSISISTRKFPFRVRADLQRAMDRLFGDKVTVKHFCGLAKDYAREGLTLSDCIVPDYHNPVVSVPPQYEELNIGAEESVRCLKNGIWFLEDGPNRYVVLLSESQRYGCATGIQFEIGTVNNSEGTRLVQEFFRHLEESVLKAESYRGKILSLEMAEHSYSGESTGIQVHKLRTVEKEQVILPRETLELLERNVIGFVNKRSELSRFRQSTRKGILFYGPPGTGKTHTIHYLSRALPGHTTLLITAEQMGLLAEYMTLARLLQPSIVVIEDADLIARNRNDMDTCEEILLNKLLNEMDGLKEDADILFILTTNRPEALEVALSARPGRIDQAIEFPHPNPEGRAKLIRLYSTGIEVSEEVVAEIVQRTDRVSAAFIKELMRRSVQFHLENSNNGRLESRDYQAALDEMLFSGGSLNLKLLGGPEQSAR